MKALDLFCSAGGAARGLADAGYEVTGVDLEPQPNYPYAFVQGDALDASPEWIASFDLVWASPPCQAFTAYRRRPGHVHPALNLIFETRDLLRKNARAWIIENVHGAPLQSPTMLCGSMFGLDVRRHRYFETSFPALAPACRHHVWKPRFPPATNRTNLRRTVEVGGVAHSARDAAGGDGHRLDDPRGAVAGHPAGVLEVPRRAGHREPEGGMKSEQEIESVLNAAALGIIKAIRAADADAETFLGGLGALAGLERVAGGLLGENHRCTVRLRESRERRASIIAKRIMALAAEAETAVGEADDTDGERWS